MADKLIFKNEELIKLWANTTYCKKIGDILVVKHHEDKLYYYFGKNEDGIWALKMTSTSIPASDNE